MPESLRSTGLYTAIIAAIIGSIFGSSDHWLANMITAFFQCFPSSGSFTRSAINFDAGAKTKLAGALSGVIVAVMLIFFAPYAKFIPNASLAGVIILVAFIYTTIQLLWF